VTAAVGSRAPPGTVVSTRNAATFPTQWSPSNALTESDASQLGSRLLHSSSVADGNRRDAPTVSAASRNSSALVARISIVTRRPFDAVVGGEDAMRQHYDRDPPARP
jgi:hypothetical protein